MAISAKGKPLAYDPATSLCYWLGWNENMFTYNCPKLETTWKPFDWSNGYTGIPTQSHTTPKKKERITDTHHNMDESEMHSQKSTNFLIPFM